MKFSNSPRLLSHSWLAETVAAKKARVAGREVTLLHCGSTKTFKVENAFTLSTQAT
mgnify:CR=1 FL=1